MDFSNLFSTPQQVINGVYDYFHDVYTTDSWNKYTDYWITWNDVKGRVGQNIPVKYSVGGHSVYGNHATVMVGYQEIVSYDVGWFGIKYNYKTTLFLRVADGWDTYTDGQYICYANRYINYDDANTRYMCWLA